MNNSPPIPNTKNGKPFNDQIIEILISAGELLNRTKNYNLKPIFKSKKDIVTKIDIEIEQFISDQIIKNFNHHNILGEENGGELLNDDYNWIIDPIDGTKNFFYGHPHYSIVLGLTYGDKVIAGFTYDPNRKEIFHAIQNQGFYINDKKFKVSNKIEFDNCFLSAEIPGSGIGSEKTLDFIQKIYADTIGLRISGSAALSLAYLASGRSDLFICYKLNIWDQIAGIIQITEAGGKVVDRYGKKVTLSSEGIIAGNEAIVDDFLIKSKSHNWI